VQQGNKSLNVPPGTIFTIPVEAIHYDDSVYPDSRSFNPFRFAQPGAVRDIIDATSNATSRKDGNNVEDLGTERQKSSATIDDAFLGFGFGRHACPGRFFALNEVKIFVAHMVLHYDIEHLKTPRNKMTPIIWLNVPIFNDYRVRVRKRDPVELL
jgi:cytochrome P450